MIKIQIRKTIVLCSLFVSGSAWADSLTKNPRNTLIYNGFNAASWGEIGIDSGTMDEANVFALRISAGVQILRYEDYVSLTVGYMGSGFSGVSYPEKIDDGKYTYSYAGVDISLIFFPSATHSFGVKYIPGNGQSVLKYNKDSVPSQYIAELGESTLERTNKFKINEISAIYAYSFNKFWQVGLTLGMRQIKGTYSYKGVDPNAQISGKEDNSSNNIFYGLGVRGSLI